MEHTQTSSSIAILWDIENVTPSTDSLFVRGLIDYATDIGRISIARAYGDWTRSGIRHTAEVLAENSGMLKIFYRSGMKVDTSTSEGVVGVQMELQDQGK